MSDILECNRMIAEFMGAKYGSELKTKLYDYEIWVPIHGICNYKTLEYGHGRILHYHYSWDWLMPVVEKIINDRSSSCEFCGLNYSENGYSFSMLNDEKFSYSSKSDKSLLDACYSSVVEFIKWYNEQSK